MDIKVWEQVSKFVAVDSYPKLPCPSCAQYSLSLDEDSLRKEEIDKAQLAKESHYYRNEKQTHSDKCRQSFNTLKKTSNFLELIESGLALWSAFGQAINGVTYVFNGFLYCDSCYTPVSINGIYLEPFATNASFNERPMLKIEGFSPALSIFPVSKHVPAAIEVELIAAFKAFHCDPNSAAAFLRRALEQFCKDMDAKGKNLHQRIDNLRAELPEEHRLLQTLKLLGNEGTHSDGVDALDILYGFQVFEFVLALYERRHKAAEAEAVYEKLREKYEQSNPADEQKSLPAPKQQA